MQGSLEFKGKTENQGSLVKPLAKKSRKSGQKSTDVRMEI